MRTEEALRVVQEFIDTALMIQSGTSVSFTARAIGKKNTQADIRQYLNSTGPCETSATSMSTAAAQE